MRLSKLFLSILVCSTLTSCDFFNGENGKDDTTIYHTTLAFLGVPDEVINSNNYKIEAVTYQDSDTEELIPNPTTYNEVDATYQSRVDLKAPFIPGYKFIGWYDDQGVFQGGLADSNIKDGYDYWWNQYQKNGTFYAKYELWTYTVNYGFFEKSGQSAGPNGLARGYSYNINKGEVMLSDGVTTNEHESFKEWYYRDTVSGEEVVITSLPNDYFENELVIFGRFETEKFKITAEYNHSKGSVEMVDAILTDGTPNSFIDILGNDEWKVEYGYSDFYVSFNLTPLGITVGVSVTVDGVFDGNYYIEPGNTSIHYSFRFNHGKDIVINFDFFG